MHINKNWNKIKNKNWKTEKQKHVKPKRRQRDTVPEIWKQNINKRNRIWFLLVCVASDALLPRME